MAKIGIFKRLFRKTDQKHYSELTEAVWEIHQFKKAEKIINEYGQAIVKGTEINKMKVEKFGKLPTEQQTKSLENKDAYFYALQNKFDIKLLPYEKVSIREAIELLLDEETDSKEKDILKSGLLYLDDFVAITE